VDTNTHISASAALVLDGLAAQRSEIALPIGACAHICPVFVGSLGKINAIALPEFLSTPRLSSIMAAVIAVLLPRVSLTCSGST
jgi:hypothetical protein